MHVSPEGQERAGQLAAADLGAGTRLRVVATTNIVADVVSNVGGENIEVAGLISTGADPHSYTVTPQDMRLLNDAHVIFVNGLSLEESLQSTLDNLDSEVPVVELNGDPAHLLFTHDQEQTHGHDGVDPHTWMDVRNVMAWVDAVEQTLTALDPENDTAYAANAVHYMDSLTQLDEEIRQAAESLAAERRKMVTDHEMFAYYAAAYGYEIVGTLIDSFSTMAAPSAKELAALQDQMAQEGVEVLFVGTTVNPQLAGQLAADLAIEVVELYTGSLSEADGPAATYLDYMRYNTAAIVNSLAN